MTYLLWAPRGPSLSGASGRENPTGFSPPQSAFPCVTPGFCADGGAQNADHFDASGVASGPCRSPSSSACEFVRVVFGTWSVTIALVSRRGELKGSVERTDRTGRSHRDENLGAAASSRCRRAFNSETTVYILTGRCCTVSHPERKSASCDLPLSVRAVVRLHGMGPRQKQRGQEGLHT